MGSPPSGGDAVDGAAHGGGGHHLWVGLPTVIKTQGWVVPCVSLQLLARRSRLEEVDKDRRTRWKVIRACVFK